MPTPIVALYRRKTRRWVPDLNREKIYPGSALCSLIYSADLGSSAGNENFKPYAALVENFSHNKHDSNDKRLKLM